MSKGIALGPGFKLKDGKIIRDEKALEAKMDLSTRLKRKASKKVRIVKRSSS